MGLTVRILPNLQANNQLRAIEKIVSLINEFAIGVVIIGRPEPKTSGSIAVARRADGLRNKLREVLTAAELKTEVLLWNEAMTSKRAMAELVEANVPQTKRKIAS